MKKLTSFSAFVLIILFSLMLAQPTFALPNSPESMNARFVKWQEKPHVIHILVHSDEGRPGYLPAQVAKGQPVLFGFEWGRGQSIEELQEMLDDLSFDIDLSIDSNPSFSVKDWYQDPFMAATQSGPAWSWDHDGDGPGDEDGDGFGDWTVPTMFFRYQSGGLTAGTHTFEFRVTEDGWNTVPTGPYSDTITVVAG